MRRLLNAARRACMAGVMVGAAVGVAPRRAAAQYPPVVTRSRLDPNKSVNFHAVLFPDTVYVGQQSTYQLGVFLNAEVRQRLRRNPEFIPPETRSLLVYDLPEAKAPLVGTIDGRQYEVHVFQRAFFALTPGRYDIPPAKLTYSVPQSASFFSREESHSMRSEGQALVVLPVPDAGRPADWAGAVGDWRVRLRVDSSTGRVGNPLVVTMRVEGRGNVALLPRPALAIGGASVVSADERVHLDSTPSTLRGAKEFDWLVTPHDAGALRIAPQRYAYFDPTSRRYEVSMTSGTTITVQPGDALAPDSTSAAPPATPTAEPIAAVPTVATRPSIGQAVSHAWLRAPWMLLLFVAAPWPAFVGVLRRRPRRVRAAVTNAERLRAAVEAGSRDHAALRRLAHGALRDRLALDAGLALARGTLVAELRHEGVTVETARRAETVLRLLDAAVFGEAAKAIPPAGTDLDAVIRAVDAEARGRGASRAGRRMRAVATLLALGVVTTGTAVAWQADATAKSWAAGQTAFAGGDYALALRHFLDVARVEPHRPNVWANVAAAAWQQGDTARAVQGWQRALRLQPLDTDVRSRLSQVRAVQDRGPARVPEVPVQLASVLLLLVWFGGWSVLARRAWRGQTVALRGAWLVVVAAVLLVFAAWTDDVGRARDFVVVVRPEPLRALPVLGADPGPAPLTGEVARVLKRQGAWAHIELEGQRRGWIAAELLLPLGDD